jgi:hypothetical protein
VKEMLDAARAAAETIEHHVVLDAPAQTWTPGQGVIDIGSAQHILSNE